MTGCDIAVFTRIANVRCTIESALLEHKGDQNTVLEKVGL